MPTKVDGYRVPLSEEQYPDNPGIPELRVFKTTSKIKNQAYDGESPEPLYVNREDVTLELDFGGAIQAIKFPFNAADSAPEGTESPPVELASALDALSGIIGDASSQLDIVVGDLVVGYLSTTVPEMTEELLLQSVGTALSAGVISDNFQQATEGFINDNFSAVQIIGSSTSTGKLGQFVTDYINDPLNNAFFSTLTTPQKDQLASELTQRLYNDYEISIFPTKSLNVSSNVGNFSLAPTNYNINSMAFEIANDVNDLIEEYDVIKDGIFNIIASNFYVKQLPESE